MRRKMLLTLLLSLVLVFALTAVALASYCMACGTELPDGAKFCYSCGAKQSVGNGSSGSSGSNTTSVSSVSAMEISKITDNGDGTVSVRWNDPENNGPYQVCLRQRFSHDYHADRNMGMHYWLAADNVSSSMAVIDTMVPGVDYWIVVENENNDYVYEEYEAGSLPRFYEFGTDISIELKRRRNNANENLVTFSASDFNKNRSSASFGAYIRLDYPRLAKARQYRYMVSITDPTGEVIVVDRGDMELSRGLTYTYWNFYSFDWYLDKLAEHHGSLPVGKYVWSLYYDGKFVNSQEFRISN